MWHKILIKNSQQSLQWCPFARFMLYHDCCTGDLFRGFHRTPWMLCLRHFRISIPCEGKYYCLLSWMPASSCWPSQCSCYNQNSLLTSVWINVLRSKRMLKASLIFLLKLPLTIDMAPSSIPASWRNCWRDLWQSLTQLPQLHHPTLLCHPA